MISETELNNLKFDLGILEEAECSVEEDKIYTALLKEKKPLPDGVLCTNPDEDEPCFSIIKETPLSKEALSEYIQLKQLKTLITIKNCVIFFTVLTILGLILTLLFLS